MEKRTSPNRASAVVSAPRRNPNPNHAVPQLNCELCRDRKVRCDKLDPCTNCVSAGAVCVPVHRLRLRRGRHAHRSSAPVDEDLKRRIRRLEALISDASPVGAEVGAGSGRVGLVSWARLIRVSGVVTVAMLMTRGYTIVRRRFGSPAHRFGSPRRHIFGSGGFQLAREASTFGATA